MSSRREVLIKILALLQMKTLLKTKKSHIEMFKTALFDGAINEKCRVFGGGGGGGLGGICAFDFTGIKVTAVRPMLLIRW